MKGEAEINQLGRRLVDLCLHLLVYYRLHGSASNRPLLIDMQQASQTSAVWAQVVFHVTRNMYMSGALWKMVGVQYHDIVTTGPTASTRYAISGRGMAAGGAVARLASQSIVLYQ